jgi:WD40 repeat protein
LGGLLVGHSAFQTSPNGRLFVQGYQNILIYDLAAQGNPVQLLESLGGYLAVADDGVTLVATGYDGNVQQPSLTVWDASTAMGRHYLTLANEFNINQIAISPDGTRFATAHGLSEGNFIGQETPQPSVVRLWDTLAGTQSAELPHPTGINQLAFSPDGTRLVTGSGRTATVWDLNTNTPVTSFPINAVLYNRLLAFSPDGTRLAVGQSDGTLNVYETGGYSLLYSVPLVVDNPVTFAIYNVAFSPDGTRLTATVAPFFDGPVGELNLNNPELAGRAVIVAAADGTLEGSLNFGGIVPTMSGFSPDGSYLIVSVNNALEFYGTAQ